MISNHGRCQVPLGDVAREGAAPVETPCIGLCVVEPASRSCKGCGRTIDEIAGWLGFTPEKRRLIMQELPARRQPVARGVR